MNSDRRVSAEFTAVATPVPTVTITVALLEGSGSGTVVSDRDGMACTATACSGAFPRSAERITLTAVPDEGDYFNGWGPDCNSETSTCQLPLDTNHEATVTFGQSEE